MLTASILMNTCTVRRSGDSTWQGDYWHVPKLTSCSDQSRPRPSSAVTAPTQASSFCIQPCCSFVLPSLCFQQCCREERAKAPAAGQKGLPRRQDFELLRHQWQRAERIAHSNCVRWCSVGQAQCIIVPHSLQDLPTAEEVLVAQLPGRSTAKLLTGGEELKAARSAIKQLMEC